MKIFGKEVFKKKEKETLNIKFYKIDWDKVDTKELKEMVKFMMWYLELTDKDGYINQDGVNKLHLKDAIDKDDFVIKTYFKK